jgi:hypothetical protein
MTQPVSGDIQLMDKNGVIYRIKHSADRVDGTCSVICHYDYKKRDRYVSYISGIDSSYHAQRVHLKNHSNDDIEASYEAMFQANKHRMENAGEAEEALFRLLIRNGLMIGRYPHNPSSLEQELNEAIANGLFNTIRASRQDYIPKITTGGFYDSKRVLELLLSFPTFKNYLVDYVSSVYVGGKISSIFVNLYDNTIPRQTQESKEIDSLRNRISLLSKAILDKETRFNLTRFNVACKCKHFQDEIDLLNQGDSTLKSSFDIQRLQNEILLLENAMRSKETRFRLTIFNAKSKIERIQDEIVALSQNIA